MAFTPIIITGGPFLRPDGQPAQGTATATLSEAMANGTERVEPSPVAGVLDGAGMLVDNSGEQPFTVLACNDPGTTPAAPSAVYAFVLELDVTAVDPFTAVVPYNAPGGTIDISALA